MQESGGFFAIGRLICFTFFTTLLSTPSRLAMTRCDNLVFGRRFPLLSHHTPTPASGTINSISYTVKRDNGQKNLPIYNISDNT